MAFVVVYDAYEPFINVVTLPDPDDRHVLAAAIKARAQMIVTNNIKDFPASTFTAQAKSSRDLVGDEWAVWIAGVMA